jgi:hypothetical protein
VKLQGEMAAEAQIHKIYDRKKDLLNRSSVQMKWVFLQVE